MRILSIAFAGYRCFGRSSTRFDPAQMQRLELAPLTLVFGKNNSGKSAVVRLAHLVLAGLQHEGAEPLPLRVGTRRFADQFNQLLHNRSRVQPFDLQVELERSPSVATLEARLIQLGQLDDDAPGQVLEHRWRGVAVAAQGGARGLLPDNQDARPWRDDARRMWLDSRWIGPVRPAVPDRIKPLPVDESDPSMPIPANDALVPSQLWHDAALREEISRWLDGQLGVGRLELRYTDDRLALGLRRDGSTIDLADSGEGVRQVLPVLTHALRRRLQPRSGWLDVIEQPELHLHDAAHPPLGDLLIEATRAPGSCLLVETHSEGLLMRVRRRVAEGLDPAHVALYYVGDGPRGRQLQRLGLDANGEVSGWPEGVFSEVFEEVKALRRAQRRRAGEGA